MTTRRRFQMARKERLVTDLEKAREERLVAGLEKARDALINIIDDVEQGDTTGVTDALEAVNDRINRAYGQAERMEERDER